MKTILHLPLTRALRLRGTFLALLAGSLAAGLAATHAGPPSVQPLRQGKWPAVRNGPAYDVMVVGKYACVALREGGSAVIDVSDPTNCVAVGRCATRWLAYGVAAVGNRIYVADYDAGRVVLPTLPNVQFTVRVDATPGVPFTLEAATDFSSLMPWTPLLTTNVPTMPFDYVDFDVKFSEKPHKYYRVRQP